MRSTQQERRLAKGVRECDGCGQIAISESFPRTWQMLEVKKHTDVSTAPIHRGSVKICSIACAKKALMKFWDSEIA